VQQIRRLAIVNRGEAAIRALTAVAELAEAGDQPPITTVLVHTDPDARAWYVREADEALSLGAATYVDPADGRRKSSYLDEERVIAALREARVDAVWVGWGFLAESASFARRCEEAGLSYVGPGSETIRLLGDKVAAKQLAERAGLPVVPWSGGPVADLGQAALVAAGLGYPVVVKAVAGGGGRGIRVARDPADLGPAFQAARSEAELAFGDPTVFIERQVLAARHIEVQVIADGYGTVWALGVRDCSIQRRQQKVIEESASTMLDDAAEREIRQAAVNLMIAAGYRNAGTVEFLLPPDGAAFMFMEVNTRLQVEHPVTELTTGVDLVKLQLHVAAGGRLYGPPPPSRGHAIEARLCAEDPERGFEPSPGRIAMLALPTGPGIRVDTGVREGDEIPAEFDSMIAKIIAWGRDRDEALARLRRALGQLTVVVAGGTSNQSFLLSVLGRAEFRDGAADIQWLDRLTADAAHLPAADPVAVLQAAVEAYDVDQAAEQAAFHARAARGNPEPSPAVGHPVQFRYRGEAFRLHVYRTGRSSYRIAHQGTLTDITVDRVNAYERRIVVNGRRHRIVAATAGPVVRVDIDGISHRMSRDDGGVVRCECPGVVVAVRVAPGDVVAAGDPLVVLESMKMEAVLTAPSGGAVTAVEVAANDQVEAGAPLLRIAAGRGSVESLGSLDLTGLAVPPDPAEPPSERVYSVLLGHLLGYDLDPASVHEAIAAQRRLPEITPPDDPGLLEREDRLLEVFTDAALLYRPRTDHEGDGGYVAGGPQALLLAFAQWLDADRARLPDIYRAHLARALRRYGVASLDRSPQLEEAVVWLFRSVRRAGELSPVVLAILERRLRYRQQLRRLADPGLGVRLDLLAAASQGYYQDVADLARTVRFRYLEEPRLEAADRAQHADLRRQLDLLSADPAAAGVLDGVRGLIPARPDLHALLLQRLAAGRAAAADAFGAALLEVLARGFYPGCELRDPAVVRCDGQPIRTIAGQAGDGQAGQAGDGQAELVVAALPLAGLPDLAAVLAERLADLDPEHEVVLDLQTWRHDALPGYDETAASVAEFLAGCALGPRLGRLNLTVASLTGPPPGRDAVQQLTFRRRDDGRFEEDRIHRGLHPMLAWRLELWRLSKFRLRRLPSPAGVYLFYGAARGDPADQRLFALAEVGDLTPTRDASGAVRYRRLDLMGLLTSSAIREALAAMPRATRPAANRIMLSVRPPWDLPPQEWPAVAGTFSPLAGATGLQKVVLRVHIPGSFGERRESMLHIDGLGRTGPVVREQPAGAERICALTPYQRKVLRACRLGAPYPYEIVQLLAPPPGAVSRFPGGTFREYDLDRAGTLLPVRRAYAHNTANVVIGLVTNYTAKVPEGMARVIILSDPTWGLGNVAEPECRRILAALGLARRMGVPVDWFALSSGARIALDSGTENMDWTAAVLRGLVEFTQADGDINIVVTGVNVGAQAYWNAEATMLMHTRGILVMAPRTAMMLTGKQSLDYSGCVSAEDNFGIGGFDRVMGPNGQAQYWAPTFEDACQILLDHHEHTFVVPGERHPRRAVTKDDPDRDVRRSPHPPLPGSDFTTVGDVFCPRRNPERKKPFDIRAVLRAVIDADARPLERWAYWHGASTAVVWDAQLGGIPVCLIGLESQTSQRGGFVPADGPASWAAGTLFPQSARKLARAINAASRNRPLVVLANLSGFDGSPESMRRWQLEYGAEIGRAVTNFRGPIVFVVITRYHGGAFVVFSKRLNDQMETAAVEGSFASVIGGAPAAATVFARDVRTRTAADPRVLRLRERLGAADARQAAAAEASLTEMSAAVRSEKLGEVAREFDQVHSIHRALAVGSVDRIIPASELRPYLIDAVERGLRRAAAE